MDNKEYFNESIENSVKSASGDKERKKLEKELFNAVKVFEQDIIDSKDARIKTLTKGLVASLCVSVLLGVAIVVLTPLKTSVPYLLRVDNTTGYVDKVEPYNSKKNTADEAVVRYFIAKYIVNRESYDWHLIQSMYDFVGETSSSQLFTAYKSYYASEYSPLKKLAKKTKMIAVVNSITFLDANTVQVRFTKKFEENDGKRVSHLPETTWLATISFDFDKKIRTEKQRLLNPLGFQVVSYKVDAEVK